jgi:hypothetical protein
MAGIDDCARRCKQARLPEILPAKARTALAHLRKACGFARDLRIDPWEFALRLRHLVGLGVDESDLHWLVLNGYVDRADEPLAIRDPARRFQRRANIAFNGETCFVITAAGASVAGPGGESRDSSSSGSSDSPGIVAISSPLPQWDQKLRVLCFDGCVVKRFRLPAGNQEAVLSTLEQEGWPASIDDPLPFLPRQRPVERPQQRSKERLHATIRCLNAHHENRLIRFRGNGTGEAVLWEPIAQSAVDRPATTAGLRRAA